MGSGTDNITARVDVLPVSAIVRKVIVQKGGGKKKFVNGLHLEVYYKLQEFLGD